MQQAARVAEFTGFFLLGKLIEFDKTEIIFKRPAKRETEDYITGRSVDPGVDLSQELSVIHFREELDELQSRLLEMAGLVESAIHQSVAALVQRDEQAAKEVLWKEAHINQKDIEIDEYATRLLALVSTHGRDMRFLTAVIKINGDLERMGDLAVNITQRALSLMRDPPVKPLIDIPQMASLAEDMVRKSLDAMVKRDEELARSVLLQTTRWTACATPFTRSWSPSCKNRAPPSRGPST